MKYTVIGVLIGGVAVTQAAMPPICSGGIDDYQGGPFQYTKPGVPKVTTTCGESVQKFELFLKKVPTSWSVATCDEGGYLTNYDDMNYDGLQSCCKSGKLACDVAKAIPSVCQSEADNKPDSTVPDSSSTSKGYTCGQLKSSIQADLKSGSYPFPKSWTPKTCDIDYPTSLNLKSTRNSTTVYSTIWANSMRQCCTSGKLACDVAKAVPQMCAGGDSDMLPDSTVYTAATSTKAAVSCGDVKTVIQGIADPKIFPFSKWTTTVCQTKTTLKEINIDLAKGTAKNEFQKLEVYVDERYAPSCCTKQIGACFVPVTAAASCFSGSDTVVLENGATRPLEDVRVGDRVLTANAAGALSFADVVFLPHATNKEVATFAELTTGSGKTIKATKMHLLQACSGELAYAGSFKKGGCLRTVDGPETIVSAAVTTAEGLYTAVTNNEFIVVNGVIASPFAVSHTAGHYFYNLHRTIYKVSPSLLTSRAAKAFNAAMASAAAVALRFSAVSM